MRKFFTLAAVTFSLALPAAVQADGKLAYLLQRDQYGFKKPKLGPRAAPWYVYWPYPSYFNAPAPTGVAFPPGVLTPGGFQSHMYQGVGPGSGLAPYPTNGFGQ